jgi:hypothetical protein
MDIGYGGARRSRAAAGLCPGDKRLCARSAGRMATKRAAHEQWKCPGELLAFLEQVWKVSGVSRVPMPPWEDRLL